MNQDPGLRRETNVDHEGPVTAGSQCVLLIHPRTSQRDGASQPCRYAPGRVTFRLDRTCPADSARPACVIDGSIDVAWDGAATVHGALPKDWCVVQASSLGSPSIHDSLEMLVEAGVERVIAIPLTPHYSEATTGVAMDELFCCARHRARRLRLEVRTSWHDDDGYVEAMAAHLLEQINANDLTSDETTLVFLAGTGPGANEHVDEDYLAQVEASAALIGTRLGWPAERTTVAVGDPTAQVEDLLGESGDRVLVCAIALPVGGAEITESVLATAPLLAAEIGRSVLVCPDVGETDAFARTLGIIARRGSYAADKRKLEADPLIPARPEPIDPERSCDDLLMVGVSMRGTLVSSSEPGLRFSDPHQFETVKRPQAEAVELVRRVREECGLRECWLWNTCSRFELYGWFEEGTDDAERDRICDRIGEMLARGSDRVPVNTLLGREAWRHLLRTGAGMNSRLVGDSEVVDQMESAQRMAQHARTAGPLTDGLVRSAAGDIRTIREKTAWGRFSHRYCASALDRIWPRLSGDGEPRRCLVIGGSTTSCSLMGDLVERFGRRCDDLTLVYRGERKGALRRRLHEVLGEGRRISVAAYDDERILDEVVTADVVFMAVDQRRPILSGERIAARRDLRQRPLVLVDFNSFASTRDTGGVPGLDLVDIGTIEREIGEFSRDAMADPSFGSALAEAEAMIIRRVAPAKRPTRRSRTRRHPAPAHNMPGTIKAAIYRSASPE
jgi:protoheme ferro-lyase/glutamyl-tRNA reductase